MGILNARVIRQLGTRKSALLGIFMLGLGEILSGFAVKEIGGLFVTAGVVMGGSPIAGYILDASGGEEGGIKAYRPAILYAGVMALGAAVLAVGIRVKTDRRLLKRV
ncbi:uncharacterized protein BO80DRAFT_445134 [Aspergillus ibericus CBS 121593]|uniref:Major facilitator superfamily (MFS) profile domain-containing protein n=1 Tax=Aspergillus ibericus CBS 121593 TaxID=1448316 RepID=A0A395H1U8_9EURO|nr:hypothetical protein BO80DRAFT_445134 [Aspergillus ibericus CBS 121593]RAL00818.1 hypothetical protein BO80DRAFT_445134 [Aspergillus ibericus CBS 121593]